MAKNRNAPPKVSTVIMDLGGYSAKLGLVSDEAPKVLPNCIYKAKSEKKRQFVSNELSECKDQHQLFHLNPFSSGYLTNWELQQRLFDHFLGTDVLNVDAKQSHLVITEPYFNFQNLKKYFAEAIFEDFSFASAFICPPAYLTAHLYQRTYPEETSCFVVDSGHSFTHLVPVIDGNISWDKTIRVPIGGKILTNHLKQRISFQQLNVMDETHVINQLKEQMCFVSTNLQDDFRKCTGPDANSMARTFVLPDYVNIFTGFVRPLEDTSNRPTEYEQLVRLSADRFVTPEILFRPSIIGDSRMGISEAAISTIQRFPHQKQHFLFRNIVLSGGNCLLDGFSQRLLQDLQMATPEFGEVQISTLKNPILNAWFGGQALAEDSELFNKVRVTRAEYAEHGENICEKKFIRNTSKSRSF